MVIATPCPSAAIFPDEAAVTCLIGALLLAQNDEWAAQRARSMTLETIAPLSDAAAVSLPPWQPDRTANAVQERCSCTIDCSAQLEEDKQATL